MKVKDKLWASVRGSLKRMFTKNLPITIVSLVFAMGIWGYVMYTQSPARVKTLTNVSVSFEGEADLIARKLVVRGDRSKILEAVTVRVETQLANYADLSAKDITATINLNAVSMAGEYVLDINAVTQDGSIVSVSPSYVTLEIDSLVSREIPIEVEFSGELPVGYWAGDVTLSSSHVVIQGASKDVAEVARAVITVPLTDRIAGYNHSFEVELYDDSDMLMDSSLFYGEIPSATITLEILARKTVNVSTASGLLGSDNLPANYEIIELVVTPDTVDIVGEQAVLDEISSIEISPIDISGSRESVLADVVLIVPDGVQVLTGDSVSVYVGIREIVTTAVFEDVAVSAEGLGRRQTAVLTPSSVSVTISGPISIVSAIERRDVELYVTAAGFASGTYTLPISVRLPSDISISLLTVGLSSDEIQIVVN